MLIRCSASLLELFIGGRDNSEVLYMHQQSALRACYAHLTMLDDLIRGQKIKDLFNTGSDEASHSDFNNVFKVKQVSTWKNGPA